jgi:hypothetical protein
MDDRRRADQAVGEAKVRLLREIARRSLEIILKVRRIGRAES